MARLDRLECETQLAQKKKLVLVGATQVLRSENW